MDEACPSQDQSPGFTCWHLVRTWDWAVQTAIRGVPEVIADKRWAAWSMLDLTDSALGLLWSKP